MEKTENKAAGEIKAIFFDIDRTLMSHTEGIKQIPPSARRALQRLKEQGIRIYIATGRHTLEMKNLPLEGLEFDGYITLNGQLCLDGDFRPLYKNTLQGEDAEALLSLFNEKEYPVILVEEKEMYLNCVNDYVRRVQHDVTSPLPPVKAYSGGEIYMAAVFLPDGAKELRERFPSLRIVHWHHHAADILPADGGKAVGMRAIMERLGIDRSEVMAFGDEENDIDMIRFAGIGVAMGNASDPVKQAADFVTDHIDEDGVEKALRHYGLL